MRGASHVSLSHCAAIATLEIVVTHRENVTDCVCAGIYRTIYNSRASRDFRGGSSCCLNYVLPKASGVLRAAQSFLLRVLCEGIYCSVYIVSLLYIFL